MPELVGMAYRASRGDSPAFVQHVGHMWFAPISPDAPMLTAPLPGAYSLLNIPSLSFKKKIIERVCI